MLLSCACNIVVSIYTMYTLAWQRPKIDVYKNKTRYRGTNAFFESRIELHGVPMPGNLRDRLRKWQDYMKNKMRLETSKHKT